MITGGKLSLVAFLFFEYNVWKNDFREGFRHGYACIGK